MIIIIMNNKLNTPLKAMVGTRGEKKKVECYFQDKMDLSRHVTTTLI